MELLPNFVIIGTQKAGTASIYSYLSLHPDIFMSPHKEPMYFSYADGSLDLPVPGGEDAHINAGLAEKYGVEVVKDWETYHKLFENGRAHKIRGEASTWYIYSPGAAQRMQRQLPSDTRFIAILRNPAERAYSAYMYFRRRGIVLPERFEEAIKQAHTRQHPHWLKMWHMVQRGFYYEQLQRFAIFGPERLRIYLFEDFVANPGLMIEDICEYLNVDPSLITDTSTVYGKAGIPVGWKKKTLYTTLQMMRQVARPYKQRVPSILQRQFVRFENRLLTKDALTPEARQMLLNVYADDIAKLQEYLRRDLSAWNA